MRSKNKGRHEAGQSLGQMAKGLYMYLPQSTVQYTLEGIRPHATRGDHEENFRYDIIKTPVDISLQNRRALFQVRIKSLFRVQSVVHVHF